MKKLIIAIIGVAACTAFGQNADKFVDPNPYAKYAVAMTPDPKKPMAIEWHLNDRAAIDKATAPETLKAILDDECKVKLLLAEVKPGYNTPVMAAAQIAAISQYVMAGDNAAAWWKFWADDRTQERKLWAKALLTAAAEAKDDYVTEYYHAHYKALAGDIHIGSGIHIVRIVIVIEIGLLHSEFVGKIHIERFACIAKTKSKHIGFVSVHILGACIIHFEGSLCGILVVGSRNIVITATQG